MLEFRPVRLGRGRLARYILDWGVCIAQTRMQVLFKPDQAQCSRFPTSLHECTGAHTDTKTPASICIESHAHTHTHTPTDKNTHRHRHRHRQTQTDTGTHTLTHTHAHMHTHTHTHTHMPMSTCKQITTQTQLSCLDMGASGHTFRDPLLI